jgi:hypothetical protein
MSYLFPEALQKKTAAAFASQGIFASIGNAPLIETPYPHLVVEEALPPAIA